MNCPNCGGNKASNETADRLVRCQACGERRYINGITRHEFEAAYRFLQSVSAKSADRAKFGYVTFGEAADIQVAISRAMKELDNVRQLFETSATYR